MSSVSFSSSIQPALDAPSDKHLLLAAFAAPFLLAPLLFRVLLRLVVMPLDGEEHAHDDLP